MSSFAAATLSIAGFKQPRRRSTRSPVPRLQSHVTMPTLTPTWRRISMCSMRLAVRAFLVVLALFELPFQCEWLAFFSEHVLCFCILRADVLTQPHLFAEFDMCSNLYRVLYSQGSIGLPISLIATRLHLLRQRLTSKRITAMKAGKRLVVRHCIGLSERVLSLRTHESVFSIE